ncbi:putative non-specific serine/threonine protein kinase [Rosa chinensis]|uniref:Putative non-specific serine/threonine protein kinase n=1 Tax=Rosa chinensis TaxID=74649 RepID=A0A2P6Q7S5_ROSCH|nr:putative non-specific serine/threonine protein kinase [Rosa chinensis]
MGAPSSLETLVMTNNCFGGGIASCLQNCSLETIDLAGNSFTGGLPLWIGSDESPLAVLQLRSNFLTGHIPQQLCNLSQLHILDFAHKNFSGTIPKCFK